MAIDAQAGGRATAQSPVVAIPLRDRIDTLYVKGSEDRVTVILATAFEDPSDVVLGRVFLQVHDGGLLQADGLLTLPSCTSTLGAL